MTAALGTPIDVVPLLQPERAALIEVLSGLSAADWERPTECPAWTVKGIALHIVGDDLSLLSRQRDASVNGLMLWAERHPGSDFRGLLDRFNEDWVDAARFFSTGVVIDLLRATGEWTHAWYRDVDSDALGEPVPFVSFDPAPYWMIAARELLERWVHQQQIRRAVGAPEWLDVRYLSAAVSAVMRGFPQAFNALDAPETTEVAVVVAGLDEKWAVRRGSDGWFVTTPGDSDVIISFDVPTAVTVFSRGHTAREGRKLIDIAGDQALGRLVADGMAAVFGRPEGG